MIAGRARPMYKRSIGKAFIIYSFQACALESGGNEYVHASLDAYCTAEKGSNADWLDVRTLLQKIQIPLDISHGRDDFVVPYPQAEQLAEWSASSSTRVFVTGLYHHTRYFVI